jgi:hypothetical protein
MEQRAAAAFKGYGKLGMNKVKFQFGVWNDRPMDESLVNSILKNVEQTALNNVTKKSAIPVIATNDEVPFDQLLQAPSISDAMPFLELPSGVKTLKAASGQHRMEARRRLKTSTQRHITEATEKIRAAETTEKTIVIGSRTIKRLNISDDAIEALRQKVRKQESIRERLGFWLIEVFDYGKHLTQFRNISSLKFHSGTRRRGMRLAVVESRHAGHAGHPGRESHALVKAAGEIYERRRGLRRGVRTRARNGKGRCEGKGGRWGEQVLTSSGVGKHRQDDAATATMGTALS